MINQYDVLTSFEMQNHQRARSTAGYTKRLAKNRIAKKSLAASFREQLGGYLEDDSKVLEFGPGSVLYLYKVLGKFSRRVGEWTGVEIAPGNYHYIINHPIPENFRPLLGSANDKLAIEPGSLDTVIFCCSHDSMMNFDEISKNCYEYLKDEGKVILLQDLYPSTSTLRHLANLDDRKVNLLGLDGCLTNVLINDNRVISSKEYLNDSVSGIFAQYGFKIEKNEYLSFPILSSEADKAFINRVQPYAFTLLTKYTTK